MLALFYLHFCTMSMKLYESLSDQITKGQIAPVYFLYGAENYFIDKLADHVMAHAITPDEAAFNQAIYYGRSSSGGQVADHARRLPMMAPRQLVVVREAQALDNIEDLLPLLTKPVPTTVLLILYKKDRLPKDKLKFVQWSKEVVVFESKPLYESQVKLWLNHYIKSNNVKIEPDAAQILLEYLGTDLEKFANAIEKLKVGSGEQAISSALVEKIIGINRSYNVFELQEAIGQRDRSKILHISEVMRSDMRQNPNILMIASLYGYISKLYAIKGCGGRMDDIKKVVKIRSEFIIKKYIQAASKYGIEDLENMIHILREYDLKSKGVGVRHLSQEDCFFEMMLKLVAV